MFVGTHWIEFQITETLDGDTLGTAIEDVTSGIDFRELFKGAASDVLKFNFGMGQQIYEIPRDAYLRLEVENSGNVRNFQWSYTSLTDDTSFVNVPDEES